MATGNMRMLRRLLALMAFAYATVTGAPLSFGQTPKFEGVYKGTIVLTSAGSFFDANACNPSTKKFEQIMTVSGDRFYLERKAAQLNTVLSGTVSPDGAVSGSGLTPSAVQTGLSIMQMLTGKIEDNQFTGSIISRYCSYSVQMKK
jgi:hypothetical protein